MAVVQIVPREAKEAVLGNESESAWIEFPDADMIVIASDRDVVSVDVSRYASLAATNA